MDVLLGAKVPGDGHAVEVAQRLNDARVLDGPDVEEEDEGGEQDGAQGEGDADEDQLAPPVVHAHRDEGEEGVGEQSARDEPEDVSEVVHPGQESSQKEEGDREEEPAEGPPGRAEERPRVEDFHAEAGEKAEVGAGGAHLRPVGHEQGGGEVAHHARAQVDDADAEGAGQLLQVPHDDHLEDDGDGQVEDPGVEEQGRPEPVKLVGEVRGVERQHTAHVVHARHLRAE